MKIALSIGLLTVFVAGCKGATGEIDKILPLLPEIPNGVIVSDIQNRAENGNIKAQQLLGLMYLKGEEVSMDTNMAKHWFTQAADQDDAVSQLLLGVMFFHGIGVDQDYERAKEYLARPAHLNNSIAQQYLGEIFEKGLGIEPDIVKAHLWWNLAMMNEFAGAKEHLISLEEKMSEEQKEESNTLLVQTLGEIMQDVEFLKEKGEQRAERIEDNFPKTNPSPPPALESTYTPLPDLEEEEEEDSEPCTHAGWAAVYNAMSGKCECKHDYVMIDDVCQEPPYCGSNAEYDEESGRCKCNYGYKQQGGECVLGNCTANSAYNPETGNCECFNGYLVRGGQCKSAIELCGFSGKYNPNTGDCVSCGYGEYLKNGDCVSEPYCGLGGTFDANLEMCICRSGYVMKDGTCIDTISYCGIFETYKNGRCECDYGYIRSNGECISEYQYCGYGATYNQSKGICDCNSGYVLENGKCTYKMPSYDYPY